MNFFKRFSKYFIVIYILLMITLLIFDNQAEYENQYLLLFFNILLTGCVPVIITAVAGKVYLQNGSIYALLIGCGMLSLGIGSFLSAVLIFFPNNNNVTITVFNTSVFFGAICHMLAFYLAEKKRLVHIKSNSIKLVIALAAVTGAILIIMLAAIKGLIPPYYNANATTQIRSIILGLSVIFYFGNFFALYKKYIELRTDNLYWYSVSMLMFALGLSGVALTNLGTLISWAGRFAQYMGALFALLSITHMLKTAKNNNVPISAVMDDFLSDAAGNYKNIVEHTSSAIILVDDKYRIFFVNSMSTKMFQYTQIELLNSCFLDMFSNESKNKIKSDLKSYIESGKNTLGYDMELDAIDKQGNLIYLSASAMYKNILNGYRITYILHDITSRKKAEMKSNHQNSILTAIKQVYESALHHNYLHGLSEDCLRIAERATGSSCSFLGEIDEDGFLRIITVSEHGWKHGDITDHDQYSREHMSIVLRDLCGDILNKGEIVFINNPMEHSIYNQIPNGHIPISAFLCVPYKCNDKVNGIIGICNKEEGYTQCDAEMLQALTPTIFGAILHKKADENLRQEEHLLWTIIEGTDEPIYLKDMESRIMLGNTAFSRAIEAPLSEIIGRTDRDIYADKESADILMANDKVIMETRKAWTFEEKINTSKGQRIYLSAKTPWVDADGQIIGIIGISQDITERKQLETDLKKQAEELEEKSKLVTDFFVNISHEFKTPISILMMALNMLKKKTEELCAPNHSIDHYITIMNQNSMRLLRLVNNLLDITKIDAGFMQPKWERINIMEALKQIVSSTTPFAQQKEIALQFQSNIEEWVMVSDAFLLERIMLNLLSNSIKYTPSGGSICVKAEAAHQEVLICVEDNGEGIPADKQKSIFDRFVQADSSLTRNCEGCGIGLSLAKSMVELLKGQIYLDGTHTQGSRFVVALPKLHENDMNKFEKRSIVDISDKVQMEFSDIDFNP